MDIVWKIRRSDQNIPILWGGGRGVSRALFSIPDCAIGPGEVEIRASHASDAQPFLSSELAAA